MSFGPYVSVSLVSNEVVDTFALGLATSAVWRDGGLRIGLGCVVDPNAQFLSPEFTANKPVPAGAEGISYIKKLAVGFQIMVTFVPGFS